MSATAELQSCSSFVHLVQRLMFAFSDFFWSIDCCHICHHHKVFTFSSSPKPLDEFQPNFATKHECKFVQMRDYNKITQMHWHLIKIFFRSTDLILTELGTKDWSMDANLFRWRVVYKRLWQNDANALATYQNILL